jgi:hypothetical protein
MPHLLHSLTYLVYSTFGKQDPGHGILKKLTGETMAKVFVSWTGRLNNVSPSINIAASYKSIGVAEELPL